MPPFGGSNFMEKRKYDTVEEVKEAVEDYLLFLYTNGGDVNVHFSLKYENIYENQKTMLRLSSSGKCPRMIAYSIFYPEKAELPSSRAISIFQLGHFLHELERHFISQVTFLKDMEKEVYLELDNGAKVFGHVDGILELNGRDVLIDIKTLNDRAFKDMFRELKRDYLYQLNAYMYATGVREAYLWLYNKDTSHRAVVEVPFSQEIVDEILYNFNKIVSSDENNLPERMFSPQKEIRNGEYTNRLYLPWQCSYCAFTELCWPDFTKVIENGKVRYIKIEEEVMNDEDELFF